MGQGSEHQGLHEELVRLRKLCISIISTTSCVGHGGLVTHVGPRPCHSWNGARCGSAGPMQRLLLLDSHVHVAQAHMET